ncbi:MAG: cation:dicarboxylase symporter family transporter, partial [Cyclobacteriaceae bacterium]
MGLFSFYTKLSVSTRILLWMLIGSVIGLIVGESAVIVKPIGDIFLQLLIMAAIPLVFFNLLSGISSLASSRELGRVGGRVIVYYLFTTVVAITLGLTIMNWIGAGNGMTLKEEVSGEFGEMPSLPDFIINLVPTNIFKSFAEGNLIQIVVFALLLGIVVFQLPSDKKKTFQDFFESAALLMRKLVEFILKASPLGLGALMAATFGEFGGKIIGPLS